MTNLARVGLAGVAEDLREAHWKQGRFPSDVGREEILERHILEGELIYPFQPEVHADSFTIKSLARDGKPGGEKHDQDIIVSWKTGDKDLTVSSAAIAP